MLRFANHVDLLVGGRALGPISNVLLLKVKSRLLYCFDLLRRSRTSDTQVRVVSMSPREAMSIALPADGAGYIGFKCPECSRYFKVIAIGVRADTQGVYCAYCGHHDAAERFLTDDEIEQIKRIAADRVVEQVHGRFQGMVTSAFRGSKNVKVTRSSYERPPSPDRPLERDLPCKHLCDRCSLEFAYEGSAIFCPQCYAPLNSSEA